jgi:superfamily II RNA helicase
MSGRAGRRGKDDRGHVVLMVDATFDEAVAQEVMMVRGGGGGLVGFDV